MCRWPFAVRVACAKAKVNAANKASPDMTTVGNGKTEFALLVPVRRSHVLRCRTLRGVFHDRPVAASLRNHRVIGSSRGRVREKREAVA